MPEIVEGIAAAKRMSKRDMDASVLANQYAVGAGVNFDRPPDSATRTRVFIIFVAH
jgi:hypothetical protein